MVRAATESSRRVERAPARPGRLGRLLASPRTTMLAAFAVGGAVNDALGLGAGWLPGPCDYGQLAFAQSVLLVGGLLLQSGIPCWLARAVAAAPPEERAPLVRGALAANVGLALLLGVLALGLFALGPLRRGFEELLVALAIGLAWPSIAVIQIARGVAQADARFGRIAALQLAEFGGRAALALGLILLGYGVVGAAGGLALGAALAAALGFHLLVGRDGIAPLSPARAPSLAGVGAMFGALVGLALLLNLDLLSVKLLAGGDHAVAGHYQAATLLANMPYYLATTAIVSVPITPTAVSHRMILDRNRTGAGAVDDDGDDERGGGGLGGRAGGDRGADRGALRPAGVAAPGGGLPARAD